MEKYDISKNSKNLINAINVIVLNLFGFKLVSFIYFNIKYY